MIKQSDPGANATAMAFFEQRGPVGVLMLHGYSGAPGELYPMGLALAAANYTVHGPLLAGHGGAPAELFGVTWEDWLSSAVAGLRRLRAVCRTIYVCGFSAGGLLALRLAAHVPIAGLITLAPALQLRGGRLLHVTGLLQHIMPWYYPLARANFTDPAVRAAVRARVPEADLDNPAVIETIRREARVPIGSIYQLARLQSTARRELARITVPTLVLQGRRDQTVDPRSATIVAGGIRSRDKRLVWFERSGHQLPLEGEREEVWATVRAWIDQRSRI